jgi:hypothetical protein
VEFPGSRDATHQQNCGESRRTGGPGHPFYVPQMPTPPEVKDWIERWPSLITDSNPAVAALVENHESNCGEATRTLSYLRNVADRYGLSLFTHKIFRGAKSEHRIDPDRWQLSPIAGRFPCYSAGNAERPDSFVSPFTNGLEEQTGNPDHIREYL